MADNVIALKPEEKKDVTLITFGGAKLHACFSKLNREVVYAGKLWALNEQFTKSAKSPCYIEVNEHVIAELRQNANATLMIADRWASELARLEYTS